MQPMRLLPQGYRGDPKTFRIFLIFINALWLRPAPHPSSFHHRAITRRAVLLRSGRVEKGVNGSIELFGNQPMRYSQSSTQSPDTRSNSRVLWVTRTKARASACPAIRMS